MNESEDRFLIEGGHVVTMDEQLGELTGDVLIEAGRVAAVGEGLDAEGARRVPAAGKIVIPGLIDSHIHLWQTPLGGLAADTWGMEYFPTIHPFSAGFGVDDLYGATLAGALLAQTRGVTTLFDFCHTIHTPEHGDAAVEALEEAGIRAIFGYSLRHRPEAAATSFASHQERLADAQRLAESVRGRSDLLRLAIALNNLEHVDADVNAAEIACAREIGALATVHSILPGQINELERRGLLGPDIQLVHCTAASDADLSLLAEKGGTIAVTPEVEAGLMACVPVLGRALRHGVPATLGVDVPSGVSIDLLVQMRLAFTVDRMLEAQRHRAHGHPPERCDDAPTLSPRRVLSLATIEAAQALGLADRTGSITPGKEADVVIVDPRPYGLGAVDPAAYLVSQASGADVEAVFVAGRPRVLDGEPVGFDLNEAARLVADAREAVLAARAERERAAA